MAPLMKVAHLPKFYTLATEMMDLKAMLFCRCAVSRILSDTVNDLSLRQHLSINGLLELELASMFPSPDQSAPSPNDSHHNNTSHK